MAASPKASTEDAVNALVSLRGVDIPIASAVLAAIYPDRYAVLDYRALEALGHARHDVKFYAEYNAALRHAGGMRDGEAAGATCPRRRRCMRWSGRCGSGRAPMRKRSSLVRHVRTDAAGGLKSGS